MAAKKPGKWYGIGWDSYFDCQRASAEFGYQLSFGLYVQRHGIWRHRWPGKYSAFLNGWCDAADWLRRPAECSAEMAAYAARRAKSRATDYAHTAVSLV